MVINENIKLIRELSGKRQTEFAELIKIKLSNWKTYENTDVRPKAFVTVQIAKIAGVSVEDLENKKLSPSDISINFERQDEKDDKDGKRGTLTTDTEKETDILEAFLSTTNQLISGQNRLIEAHKDLTHSNKVLADTQKQLVDRIAPNSDDSSDTYSAEEVSEWLQQLGKRLAGHKVDSQGKFVAYAMKVLAELRGLDGKDTHDEATKASSHNSQV